MEKSKSFNAALDAVAKLAPQGASTGAYTAHTLGELEASHKALIEAAECILNYVNPFLGCAGSMQRAVKQAKEIRNKVGVA